MFVHITGTGSYLPERVVTNDELSQQLDTTDEWIFSHTQAARNYLDTDFGAADADKPRMNILLFGPPGTGKTEFVKYLGKELSQFL